MLRLVVVIAPALSSARILVLPRVPCLLRRGDRAAGASAARAAGGRLVQLEQRPVGPPEHAAAAVDVRVARVAHLHREARLGTVEQHAALDLVMVGVRVGVGVRARVRVRVAALDLFDGGAQPAVRHLLGPLRRELGGERALHVLLREHEGLGGALI